MHKAVFVLLLTLISSQAWATKARLTALGLDNSGTQILLDNRNVFLNPASIVKIKNGVYGEWGDNTLVSNSGTAISNVNPDAEGGIVYKHKSHSLGLQLGRQTDLSETIVTLDQNFIVPQNSVDLIYGTSMKNFDIGGSIYYANSTEETGGAEKEARYFSVSGGLVGDSYGGYLRFDIIHDAEVSALEYEGDPSFQFGGYYTVSANSLFYVEAEFNQAEFGSGGNDVDVKGTSVNAAFAYFFSKSEKLNLFVDSGLLWTDGEVGTADIKALAIPVTLGVEAPVKEWLQLRASVAQRIILNKTEVGTSKSDNLQSTVVAAGASITLEDFLIEGVLKGSTTTAEIDADDLFSNVSMTYFF